MAGFVLTDQQRFDWLRLIRTDSVGPRTFRSLVNRFGGAGAALVALPDLARSAGRAVLLPSVADIERELEQSRRLGVRLIALGEHGYPLALASLTTAPPLIAIRGHLPALQRPMVSLVGSRNASGLGLKFTEKLARELGEAGFVVVSGLARGIDTAAHKASLATGTLAVLAGGHGQIYPPQNEPLVEELIANGAAMSELPFTMEPRAHDFPRRNRLVAGVSLGVVVIEAARKSGSLITARLANEEGRTVFAVPGSPLDPRAEGTNDLIHSGARICRSAQDVIAELEPQIGQVPQPMHLFDGAGPDDGATGLGIDELDWLLGEAPFRPARQERLAALITHEAEHMPGSHAAMPDNPEGVLLDLLGSAPLNADDVVRHSTMSARVVQSTLVDLEMRGLVRRDPSGGYVRV